MMQKKSFAEKKREIETEIDRERERKPEEDYFSLQYFLVKLHTINLSCFNQDNIMKNY